MSPPSGGGRVPQRVFRGSDMPQEVQLENIRKAFQGQIGSQNIQANGVMPIATMAGAGTLVLSSAANIAWWPTSFSFASSTATQTIQVTHSLERIPIGYLNIAFNGGAAALAPASTAQWNTSAVSFAVASSAATVRFKVLLL